MSSVSIGIDARLNAYRGGGIAEYTRRLIGALAQLDDETTYRVLEHRWAAGRLVPPDAANFRSVTALTPPHHRLERLALGVEVARLRLDLLHSPDFIPPRFGARRTVITVHDLNFLHYPQFQTADSLRYYAGHIRAAVRQADHILADSAATCDDLCRLLDVPAEKITVHLLGVDQAFRPLPAAEVEAACARFGLPRGYILFVGTFEPRKNLPGLLEAYYALRQRLPDAPPLVIAGRRGWLYESIFQKAADLGLGKSIRWMENPPDADLPALYNGAAVLALPSFYEGFGFPALEAMACGVPTVVSDRGSLPEVVGDTGLLIDPDQPEALAGALARALTDDAFRARSAQAGLDRARTFTWTQTAQTTLAVYRRVLGR
jgi:glycosyltransferase involved in cell wall biosynthesis